MNVEGSMSPNAEMGFKMKQIPNHSELLSALSDDVL